MNFLRKAESPPKKLAHCWCLTPAPVALILQILQHLFMEAGLVLTGKRAGEAAAGDSMTETLSAW